MIANKWKPHTGNQRVFFCDVCGLEIEDERTIRLLRPALKWVKELRVTVTLLHASRHAHADCASHFVEQRCGAWEQSPLPLE